MDYWSLATIAGMALVTYLTRIGGDLLMRNKTLGPRATAALDAVPAAVLTAVSRQRSSPRGLPRHWQD